MALFFALFLVFTFIYVMVIKSSMNYEFGSDRKRTTTRMSVGAATFAAIGVHYILAAELLASIWTGPTGEDPGTALVVTLVAISTGTAMWGFLIPKIVFSFVGTKPVDTDRSDDAQHHTRDNTHQQESEHVQQPVFMRQQPQTNETPFIPPGTPSPISRPTTDEWLVVAPIAEQTDESQPKRPAKPILFGAGVLTLLAFATIAAVWIFNQTGDSHNLAKCDTLLRTQLASSPQLAENAGNANALIDAIQDQRAADCPRDSWNPVVTNITRNHEGNIDVNFSTNARFSRSAAATMPAEGTQRWVYIATDSQWYSSTVGDPKISEAPPASSPLPPPTYTPRPATTARLVPTHTTAPTRPTATSPPVRTPTPISVKDIYAAAFGSCGGRYHGEQKSRRQQAAKAVLNGELQSIDDFRATIEQNCAGAIESTAARLGATPVPAATPSMALALRRNPTPTPWRWPTKPPPPTWRNPTVAVSPTTPPRLHATATPKPTLHHSGQKYPGGSPLNNSEIERLIIAYTNEERKKAGLRSFIHDSMVSNIARGHSQNMAQTGQFSHQIDGKDQTARALAAGYDCRAYRNDGSYSYGLSENIAFRHRVTETIRSGQGPQQVSKYDSDQGVAQGLVQQWMNSPGHKKNILATGSNRIGVGVFVAVSEKHGIAWETIWATQNFSPCK